MNFLLKLADENWMFSLNEDSHSTAAFPVIASMRRTPDATPFSEIILNKPISPVLLT